MKKRDLGVLPRSLPQYNAANMVALIGTTNKDMDALESRLHLIKQMYHDDVRKARGPFLVAAYFYGRIELEDFVKTYNLRATNAGGSTMNTIEYVLCASIAGQGGILTAAHRFGRAGAPSQLQGGY